MTPTQIPAALADRAHDLAEALALAAGDEAAVLDVLAHTGRAVVDHEDAAALCVATLAYTYARCVVRTEPTRDTHHQGDPR